VNRVYGLRYPTRPSFALNIGSAIVLPLQGFWNTVVYFWTSWGICGVWWRGWRERLGLRRMRMRIDTVHLGGRRVGGDLDREGMELGIGMGLGKKGDSTLELGKRSSAGSLGDSF
tara:strand:+ start:875 stop:1219 length:345 start_codon:yes stop_codon:yes gene_type:complete